ncbi:MAG: hypothetical protein AAFX93_01755 [Verrucomicrobiota bacterium]
MLIEYLYTMKPTLLATIIASLSIANAVAEPVTLKIEPELVLELKAGPHKIDDVARERYFRTYHIPGMFSDEQAAWMKELNISPGRGTGPYLGHNGGDTQRAGWAPKLQKQFDNYVRIYRNADERYPGVLHSLSGGNYPGSNQVTHGDNGAEVDSTMLTKDRKGVHPDDIELNVDLIDEWVSTIKAGGANPPRYFTPLNEPDAAWGKTPDPAYDHAMFARQLAELFENKHPDVLLSGPSSAWPHPRSDWRRWQDSGWERIFIEEVGDVAGAYDLHVYSKEGWASSAGITRNHRPEQQQPEPSMYKAFLNGNQYVWDFGKIESFMDLVYAHHQATWGGPSLPLIITEFGRQGITPQKGPWFNDYSYYLFGTTITRLWMAFMDRPEIQLTVPFILPVSDPGYAQQRGQALYTRPGYPDDMSLQPTLLLDFYKFYRNFEGTRVPASWVGIDAQNELGLFLIAARNDDELLVLLHNAPDEELQLNLDLGFDVAKGDATIARMRWDGEYPEDYTAKEITGKWRIDTEAKEVIDPTELVLAPEETAIVKVKLPSAELKGTRVVERFYASQTIKPLGSEPATYRIDLPSKRINEEATLVVSVSAPKGFTKGTVLTADVNGFSQEFDLGIAEGSVDLLAPIRLPLPASALIAGDNEISLKLSAGKAPKATIGTVRIDTQTTR